MPSNYQEITKRNLHELGHGKKHLEFLGRLYSDSTHFIYELLQNAEDADATSVRFELSDDRLEVLHDGRRFTEDDVRAISRVASGTKTEDDLITIGRFGVGFKSVYSYTDAPEIHCGDEHFRIKDYIRPESAPVQNIPKDLTTRFIFPFRGDSCPSSDQAVSDISKRLRDLDVRTMLFLKNIEHVRWSVHGDETGEYLRETQACGAGHQVSVLGHHGGHKDVVETWLVFRKPVEGAEKEGKPIEIAFQLCTVDEGETAKSMKRIRPLVPRPGSALKSPLTVFFSTLTDTRLGFIIQGPYRTTPTRESIPDSDEWNRKLVCQTADMVVESLESLKRMGLLDVSALRSLPIVSDDFSPGTMFHPIYAAVENALREKSFLPAHDRGFVSASEACLTESGGLRDLLSTDQLTCWMNERPDSHRVSNGTMRWLSHKITTSAEPDLWSYIRNLRVPEIRPEAFVTHASDGFFADQPDNWHSRFYEFLTGQHALWRKPTWQGQQPILLRKAFIRLENGRTARLRDDKGEVAIRLDDTYRPDRSVKASLINSDSVKRMFEEMGVKQPNPITDIIHNILPCYDSDEPQVSLEEHLTHIEQIRVAENVASEFQPQWNNLLKRFSETAIVRMETINGPMYRKPSEAYERNEITELFFDGNPEAAFMTQEYSEEIIKFFRVAGTRDRPVVEFRQPEWNGYVNIRNNHGDHERGIDRFDPDCRVSGLSFAITNPTIKRSEYIWRDIAIPYRHQIHGEVEKSTRQNYVGSKREFKDSILGSQLKTHPWVPDKYGTFHRPGDISIHELCPGCPPDKQLAQQLGMKGSDLAHLAERAGVTEKDIDLAREISVLDEDQQRQATDFVRKLRSEREFPIGESANPERRALRATEEARAAPEKVSEKRLRTIRSSVAREDSRAYLREQYTDEKRELRCQLCQKEMPFRKRNGKPYFEAVALLVNGLNKEHRAIHGAFCPVCAAKWKEFVINDPSQENRIRDAILSESEKRFSVKIDHEEMTLCFTETHLIDLCAVLHSEFPNAVN